MSFKYKHGKPVYQVSRRPLAIIAAIVLIVVAAGYYFLVSKTDKPNLKNGNKAIVHNIKASSTNTDVNEPDFQFSLPGAWKLSAQNWDARYTSWQWQLQDKRYAGRWFEVFLDTIPTDQAYNYLLPVSAAGDAVQTGTISENCVNFTPGASPTSNRPTYTPLFKASLPSKWQQVDFLCDNANVSHQIIGTGSVGGLNSVTLTGPTTGTHKFFFLYSDSDFTPDLSVMSVILGSFKAK